MIETERYHLRKFTLEDAENLYAMDSDPDVHRYLGNNPVRDISTVYNYINSILEQYEEYGIGRLAIIDKSNGEFLGWSGLKYETNGMNNTSGYYDIGYRLKKSAWGKGIATEVATASLRYGFQVLELSEINASAHHENLASIRVLEKIGMTRIETFDYQGIKCYWFSIKK